MSGLPLPNSQLRLLTTTAPSYETPPQGRCSYSPTHMQSLWVYTAAGVAIGLLIWVSAVALPPTSADDKAMETYNKPVSPLTRAKSVRTLIPATGLPRMAVHMSAAPPQDQTQILYPSLGAVSEAVCCAVHWVVVCCPASCGTCDIMLCTGPWQLNGEAPDTASAWRGCLAKSMGRALCGVASFCRFSGPGYIRRRSHFPATYSPPACGLCHVCGKERRVYNFCGQWPFWEGANIRTFRVNLLQKGCACGASAPPPIVPSCVLWCSPEHWDISSCAPLMCFGFRFDVFRCPKASYDESKVADDERAEVPVSADQAWYMGLTALLGAGALAATAAVVRYARRLRKSRSVPKLIGALDQWAMASSTGDIPQGTLDKALKINLDTSTYGSIAEIGAGQEVCCAVFCSHRCPWALRGGPGSGLCLVFGLREGVWVWLGQGLRRRPPGLGMPDHEAEQPDCPVPTPSGLSTATRPHWSAGERGRHCPPVCGRACGKGGPPVQGTVRPCSPGRRCCGMTGHTVKPCLAHTPGGPGGSEA